LYRYYFMVLTADKIVMRPASNKILIANSIIKKVEANIRR